MAEMAAYGFIMCVPGPRVSVKFKFEFGQQ